MHDAYFTLGICYDNICNNNEAIEYYYLALKNCEDEIRKKEIYDKLIAFYIDNV